MSPDLRDPLLRDVLEGDGADDAEAQQEHVGAGVAERTQLVELVLEERTQYVQIILSSDKQRKPRNRKLIWELTTHQSLRPIVVTFGDMATSS